MAFSPIIADDPDITSVTSIDPFTSIKNCNEVLDRAGENRMEGKPSEAR
ncbi:hypothetical protein V0288_18995 [Pannus brasiliensis CCIBt3594]|uniref:Uncharacterized protein n=1 Tax=Pannus brasiliensis CCIBt3594 TaxID=1427578 RepID=A0AAW9QZM7_9CHRO